MNLKKPGAIFLLIPFPNIKESIVTNLKKLGANFLIISFSNIKKSILTNLKKPGAIFLLIPFPHIKKAYLRISKSLAQFFCSSLFQILRISKTPFYTNNNLHKNHYTNQ